MIHKKDEIKADLREPEPHKCPKCANQLECIRSWDDDTVSGCVEVIKICTSLSCDKDYFVHWAYGRIVSSNRFNDNDTKQL